MSNESSVPSCPPWNKTALDCIYMYVPSSFKVSLNSHNQSIHKDCIFLPEKKSTILNHQWLT